MNINSVSSLLSPDAPAVTSKTREAAQQFESLLIGQMLRSAHSGQTGWLGSGSDSSSDSLGDFADQQFATMLAQQGGLGLAPLISQGLDKGPQAAR